VEWAARAGSGGRVVTTATDIYAQSNRINNIDVFLLLQTLSRCQACGSTTLSEFCDECVNRSIQGEHAALEEEGMRVLMMLEQFE
tara:strand:+ start:2076 stop:2330 length:255 start_codon:yes stop_codon:yes gene_type:complete